MVDELNFNVFPMMDGVEDARRRVRELVDMVSSIRPEATESNLRRTHRVFQDGGVRFFALRRMSTFKHTHDTQNIALARTTITMRYFSLQRLGSQGTR